LKAQSLPRVGRRSRLPEELTTTNSQALTGRTTYGSLTDAPHSEVRLTNGRGITEDDYHD